jgi:hypothetical protein
VRELMVRVLSPPIPFEIDMITQSVAGALPRWRQEQSKHKRADSAFVHLIP